MKRVSITLLSLFTTVVVVNAQSLEEFENKLSLVERNDSYDYVQYANITIKADSSSRQAFVDMKYQRVDELTGEVEQPTKQGYRIGVFFDNSATARARAEQVLHKCDSLLADIPATLSYDNPYFKVSAGYSISQEEAVMMLHRVQRYFPSAYLMREQVTPMDIVRSREAELRSISPTEEDHTHSRPMDDIVPDAL